MVFRKKNKDEKPLRVVSINFNTTPYNLLKTLRFVILVLYIVTWASFFVALFEYMLGYVSILILLFAGIELRRKEKAFGWWFIISLILTMFFGLFAMVNNVILFIAGAYLTPIFGNIYPLRKVEEEMKKDDTLSEVMNVGYYEDVEEKKERA